MCVYLCPSNDKGIVMVDKGLNYKCAIFYEALVLITFFADDFYTCIATG